MSNASDSPTQPSQSTPDQSTPDKSGAPVPTLTEAVGNEGAAQPAAETHLDFHRDTNQTKFLLQLADALNTTLDLKTMLERTAALVRAVIDYRIFAILLINDRTQDLRMRFQIGHTKEIERLRIRLGQGVVGQVALTREPMLIHDIAKVQNYINANPNVRSELAVPLIIKNRIVGVIDIQAEQRGYFQPEHLRLLTLTASRIAQAIENARLYTRVARQAQTLEVLNEISRDLTSILDVEALFVRMSQLLRRIIDYQIFSIWMVNNEEQTLENHFTLRFGERTHPDEHLPLERGLVGVAITERKPVNVGDVRRDARYHMSNQETRSELAIPLIYKNRVVGVLNLEQTRTYAFTEDHERALTTLAAQIAISIENAQLYQRVAQQEQRLEHDMQMARDVQLRLMPKHSPLHRHATFASRFEPARIIGGDLYDYLSYDETHTAIAVGDVSGKGAPAALFAALVSGIMRSMAAQHPAPATMLQVLNRALHERRLDTQYVAMLFTVWNDANQTLQIANAGAIQPVFCHDGEVELIPVAGFPLGMFAEASYEEISLATRSGDTLVFFSDGLSDAENEAGEMYGTERLLGSIGRHASLSAQAMAEAIFAEITEFQGSHDRFDDETLIVLRVT